MNFAIIILKAVLEIFVTESVCCTLKMGDKINCQWSGIKVRITIPVISAKSVFSVLGSNSDQVCFIHFVPIPLKNARMV